MEQILSSDIGAAIELSIHLPAQDPAANDTADVRATEFGSTIKDLVKGLQLIVDRATKEWCQAASEQETLLYIVDMSRFGM